MQEETYKDIPCYERVYQISTLGNVKSLKWNKERVLKPCPNKDGYYTLNLSKKGKCSLKKVHQLMAITYLDHNPCGMKKVVNHINFNRQDNRIENLEIITHRENTNRKHLNSSSKYTGVHWNKSAKRWQSRISINSKTVHLGYFKDEIKAHKRYLKELKKIENE